MDKNEHLDLFPAKRQALIMEKIKQYRGVTVTALSKELFVNEATIRRDLNYLAKSGFITRTYGGAALVEGLDQEIPLLVRESTHPEAKKLIGKAAASLIHDGDTLFLDSSSTTSFIIPHILNRKGLKIVTNGAKAILLLSELYGSEIHSTGGTLRENSLSLIGPLARTCAGQYHFDSCFFSCRGVDREKGLTDANEEEAELRKIILTNSKTKYLLADNTKLNQISFCNIAPVQTISGLITDRQPGREWLQFLAENEIQCIVAD